MGATVSATVSGSVAAVVMPCGCCGSVVLWLI